MSVCCCSLAGTAACRYCNNNPYAEPSPYRTITTITTNGATGFKGFGDVFAWKKPERPPRCDDCKYYHKEGESPANPDCNYGDCRRYAPRLNEPSIRVKGSYWCGEYTEAP